MKSLPLALPRPGLTEDLDLTADGSVVAVVRNGDDVRIVTPTWQRELPAPIRFPRVRALDDDRVLVVDSRTANYAPNAWILDRHRGVTAHFLAGDAIEDIVISPPFIVVTYFDEAFTSDGPAGEGVSFFDSDGQFLWGYRTQFGDEAVDVMDVYAASTDAAGFLWFYPYTEFPLVRVDMHTREQTIFTPPEAWRARTRSASAIAPRTLWVRITDTERSSHGRSERPKHVTLASSAVKHAGFLEGAFSTAPRENGAW